MMGIQLINAFLGIWLMVSPDLFSSGSAAADNNHIIGPLIATFAIISLWEATHSVRLWNIPLGLWLIIAPFILGYEQNLSAINNIIVGITVSLLAFKKGKIQEKFGGGWKILWKKNNS